MSAHVLLNLLNELGKRDKMRGLPSILSLFRNELNKFNKTRTRMLDFILYKVMKYRKILIKYNAYFKKAVFHSRENIKSCIFTAVKM